MDLRLRGNIPKSEDAYYDLLTDLQTRTQVHVLTSVDRQNLYGGIVILTFPVPALEL